MKTADELKQTVATLPSEHSFNLWLDEQLREIVADLKRQESEAA